MTRLRSWLVVAMVQWSCYGGSVFVVFLDFDFVHKRNAFCGVVFLWRRGEEADGDVDAPFLFPSMTVVRS